MSDLINGIVTKITDIGNRLGEAELTRLQAKYLEGLHGKVGSCFLTRAKLKDGVRNITFNYFVREKEIKEHRPDVYEVVYQCWLGNHRDFVLSLFEREYLDIAARTVLFTSYWCVRHPFHFLYLSWAAKKLIPTSTEVYVDMSTLLFLDRT